MADARSTEEEIRLFDVKMSQLKREYDQYFLGTRPREPVQLAAELRKLIAQLSNTAITNTALRFKYGSLGSRYQALNRQWQENLRKIEQGTYERHRFKAALHAAGTPPPAPPTGSSASGSEIYAAYVEARQACGQDVASLTPAKFRAVLEQQAQALRQRFGGETEVRFRVVVEDGRAKLKASRAEA